MKLAPILFLLLAITLLISTATAACIGNLVKLPDKFSTARCLDGTPGAFYIQTVPNSLKWMIALEGGGECVNEEECMHRSKGGLGSSSQYSSVSNFGQIQACDSTNPFADWNKVYIKYCSGDLFFGRDVRPNSRAFGLQFSGYNIVQATIDFLMEEFKFHQADDIILSGYSAGGLGVVTIGDTILDWVYRRIGFQPTPTQKTMRIIEGVQYLGPKAGIVPIAGYHFETDPIYIKKNSTDPDPVDFIPWKFTPDWKNYYTLWNATIPIRCEHQQKWEQRWEPWECLIAQGNYQSSVTPWFVIQSTVDSVVLPLHGGCPTPWNADSQGVKRCNTDDAECPASVRDYMRIWHGNITSHLAPVENKHLKAFNDNNNNNIDGIAKSSPALSKLVSNNSKQFINSRLQKVSTPNKIKVDGAFASACLLHTEFGTFWPIINQLNYKQALWNWYNDDQIYSSNDKNPHFHMDRCTDGNILCGICKN
jgi:hypothetical protein